MTGTPAEVWTFKSDSSPGKTYETIRWSDGSTSCDCPGWTRRAIRTCKHTRYVDQGIADSYAFAHQRYEQGTVTRPMPSNTKPIPARQEKMPSLCRF